MNVARGRTRLGGIRWHTNTSLHSEGVSSDSIRPCLHCQFYPTHTVRERHASGCPCTLRPHQGWRCSVNARVDASGSPTTGRLRISAD